MSRVLKTGISREGKIKSELMASSNKILVFSAAVRGFHIYRDVWTPYENEELICLHEEGNLFDMFAIKTCRIEDEITVGHLPREISRPTKYLIERGAKVTVKLSSTHYRKSPLFQGGLEIPCAVTVSLPASIKGHMLIQRYQDMVEELYCEPKEEVIMGSFVENNLNVTNTNDIANPPQPKRKKTVKKTENPKGCQDIRALFRRVEKRSKGEDVCINID